MKKTIRRIIRFLVSAPLSWKIISLFIKVFYRFKFEKELIEIEKTHLKQSITEKPIKALFPELIVCHGSFKGMIYPAYESHGSSLYPKLLGSYENELVAIIEEICAANYEDIIDVGCAEGFYAVGLAMRTPVSKIHAFDIDEKAIQACKKMAQMNHVSERITFGSYCSSNTLKEFPFRKKGLVIADCEGYELLLFNRECIPNLLNVDVLVEMHDGKDERISPYLLELFASSHDVQLIQSINCLKKAAHFPELSSLSQEELLICLQERNGIQQWAFFRSKKNNDK
jgi:hypothetical protein